MLAVHRTIVVVDIEGFGDPRRTNRNQVAVRNGLYEVMRAAFYDAGLPWADDSHEDRGDGIFGLIPAEVPKSLFVESLPSALVMALRTHNNSHPREERIRLRMALHAGEVNYDEHGVTAASINLAFRLLEAKELKAALASSPGVLAIIASSWFYEEVVRHSTANVDEYRRVRVTVKETSTAGWICLPDRITFAAESMLKRAPIAAAVPLALPVPVAGAGACDAGLLPVSVPLGRLPAEVRGRDVLLAEMRRPLTRRRQRLDSTWILAGMGGLGKSTIALAVAQSAQARNWRVWWVTATDATSLNGGILEILHQLGAPESVTRPVREGTPTAPTRFWEFLNDANPAAGRWLLIFDNADAPAVLAAHGSVSPADGTGWLRAHSGGMVVVTTRTRDQRVWGLWVTMRELRPLDEATAAQVLADLAPEIRDPAGEQARALARRLGGLPLALHLAGAYLASRFARWDTFSDYHHALDSADLPVAMGDLDDQTGQARATIQRTWDLSLDALTAQGRPETRPVLFILSAYAPATPIPIALLRADKLSHLVDQAGGQGRADAVGSRTSEIEGRLRSALEGLATVGLIDITDGNGWPIRKAVTVHPVVADANRSHLLTTAGQDLQAIGNAAVSLLQAACGELDPARPPDWPAWHLLVPHVTAVLEWLSPHLQADSLAILLDISIRAATALESESYSAAEKLSRASVSAGRGLGPDHPACLAARGGLARVIGRQGHNKQAENMLRDLLADQCRVLGSRHPGTMATRYYLGWMIEYQGRYTEAEDLLRDLLADQELVLDDDHPHVLGTRHRLARLTEAQGRHQEAEQMFRDVLAAQKDAIGEDHPETLATRHNLVLAIFGQGRYAEAEQACRQVLGDRQRVLGRDHPAVHTTLNHLAWVLADQGRYDEAEQICRDVLPDRQRIAGNEHPATLTTRHRLAWITGRQGHYAEAELMLREVLADRRKVLGDDHPSTLATRHRLAWVIADQGRYGEAENACRQVLADRQRVLGPQHPDTLKTAHRLAQIIAAQGRNDEAAQILRQLCHNRQALLGSQHPDTQHAREDLARVAHSLDSPPR